MVQFRFSTGKAKGGKQVQPQQADISPKQTNTVQIQGTRATSMEGQQPVASVPQPAPIELPMLELLHEAIVAEGVAIRTSKQLHQRSTSCTMLCLNIALQTCTHLQILRNTCLISIQSCERKNKSFLVSQIHHKTPAEMVLISKIKFFTIKPSTSHIWKTRHQEAIKIWKGAPQNFSYSTVKEKMANWLFF